jgi:transposase/DNA-directed RNA polymerase subunit RPC12/RpoP
MDRDSLKRFLDQGLSLEQIGRRVNRHPSTVGYWAKKYALQSAHQGKYAARGGIDRDRLVELIQEGHSLAGIARMLGRSPTTVRHWVKKYQLQTAKTQRVREGKKARADGLGIVRMRCNKHGLTDFWLEGRGAYRCMRCRVEVVAKRRKNVRDTLIAEAGGRCAICGYDRCPAALHFHHVDPATKRFNVRGGRTPALETLRDEARKCVLFCSNCHAEVEANATALPATVSGVKIGADRTTNPA